MPILICKSASAPSLEINVFEGVVHIDPSILSWTMLVKEMS